MIEEAINKEEILLSIKQSITIDEIEKIRINWLGKNGKLTSAMKTLSSLSNDEKKTQGKALNALKNAIEESIASTLKTFQKTQKNSAHDFSIPHSFTTGHEHLISKSIKQLKNIFEHLGFDEITGPDIEKIYYNFDALRISQKHPARDNNDTFYMEQNEMLLRTQCTTTQIRLLEQMQITNTQETRSYSIGQVFRNDSIDATHSCMFHQVEGIIIEAITIEHMIGLITYMLEEFFEKTITVEFRPSYFPFTEPSFEVFALMDNHCLEIGGCGIIHPDILNNHNLNDKIGFAFGMGLERLIMLKYEIKNLNLLYDNQVSFAQTINACSFI